jgi:class 3 adenylate cyclase
VRVPRTFVFVDLSGFTSFTASQGDDAAGRLLAQFRNLIRQVASDRGVRVAKWLGDGCMLVSVDQVNAVAATMALAARADEACAPLTMRAGLASGLALLFEGDDYIGGAVNLAARLCDAACGPQVLMPAEQAEGGLPPGVSAKLIGTFDLPGFPESEPVVQLLGVPDSGSGDSEDLWTRSPFVA